MDKVTEKFIKEMDELIEETLTEEFFDYGDTFRAMEDMISSFDTFKKKITKQEQELPIGYRF